MGQILISNFLTPKKAQPCVRPRRLRHRGQKSAEGLTCRWVSEKRYIHVYINNFLYISPIYREALRGRICMKVCTGGHLANLINCAKFYLNQVKGFDSVGVEFLSFSYERDAAVNTGLKLPFSLWCSDNKCKL